MKYFINIFMLAAILGVGVLGCASDRYIVITENYASYIAVGKPEVSGDGNTISFKDETGKEITVQRSVLKEMRRID